MLGCEPRRAANAARPRGRPRWLPEAGTRALPRGGEDSVDLAPMYQIMRPHQTKNMAYAFRPALGVLSGTLEVLRCQLAPEVQVGRAERPQLIQGLRERYLAVAKLLGPPILIISLEERAFRREDHAGSKAGAEITVRQMLDHLHGRPFARGFGPPEHRLGHATKSLC